MKRAIIPTIIVLVILGVFVYVGLSREKANLYDENSDELNDETEQIIEVGDNELEETVADEIARPQVFLSQLAAHNTSSDCWVAYQGKVYDVTGWIPKHPGGANAIARYCGTASEFEAAFNAQHGTSKEETLRKEGVLMGELVQA